MIKSENLIAGAQNLLINCAQIQAGESVLIVQEDPALGWYDHAAAAAVIAEAKSMQAEVTVYRVGQPSNHSDPDLEKLRSRYDCTIFFARIGDQERFSCRATQQRCVMCYARNADMLASSFGRTKHQAMLSLKKAIDDCYFNATQVEISCPLGSRYSGTLPKTLECEAEDVSVLRFPMGIHTPISAEYFSGRIALPEYLTSTGCKVYEPASLPIKESVFAEVEGTAIIGFSGDTSDVQRIEDHYQHIAEQFDLTPFVVNSWHAGIHNACSYGEAVGDAMSDNPDRWGNNVFMHPSILHFHSCGNEGLGEICWNIINPTIKLDGKALWEEGRLCLINLPQTKRCLEEWPELLVPSPQLA